jgi:hypothetical protein
MLVQKAAKISKPRGNKIPQQNRIQAPPNWQWEMRTKLPQTLPKLTIKLQIVIDEMNTNFIVVLVQKLQLSKPRMKGEKNSITKNRKTSSSKIVNPHKLCN